MLAILCGTLWLNGCAHPNAPFPRTDHFDGRRFHNIEPVPPETFSEQVKVSWELLRKPGKWPKHFTTPQQQIAEKTVMTGPKITFIGHATALVQVGGMNILTDPVFFDYIEHNRVLGQRRVTNAGVNIESLPHIDVILISHNHYDHLDLRSIREIAAHQGGNPPRILTGLGNKMLLQKAGEIETVMSAQRERLTLDDPTVNLSHAPLAAEAAPAHTLTPQGRLTYRSTNSVVLWLHVTQHSKAYQSSRQRL
ncbi:MAG: outer membrane protein romA [Acidobacteriaceae bacterium]|nr:outer membrane protein romA [Acidobacteriaceae bacterium]